MSARRSAIEASGLRKSAYGLEPELLLEAIGGSAA
jgi:hypothetical protein